MALILTNIDHATFLAQVRMHNKINGLVRNRKQWPTLIRASLLLTMLGSYPDGSSIVVLGSVAQTTSLYAYA